jgi:hypothetical protein
MLPFLLMFRTASLAHAYLSCCTLLTAGAAGGGGVSAKQPLKDCGTGGVVALAVSPVASDAVLCAHAYGRITLHSISRAHAVAAWQHVTGAAPVSVR